MVLEPSLMPHRQIKIAALRINECGIDSDDVVSVFGVVASISIQPLCTFRKLHSFLNLLHQLIMLMFCRAGTGSKTDR